MHALLHAVLIEDTVNTVGQCKSVLDWQPAQTNSTYAARTGFHMFVNGA
jgi:hypothetical protein